MAIQPRRLLVTGATGKQGGALIRSLLSKPNQPVQILALTRDRKTTSAQALASKPNVEIIEGDLDDCAVVFASAQKAGGGGAIWGVFSVQTPLPNAKREETRGKALTAAAVKAGVKHVVYTSAERGGDERSARDATVVPHFASKFAIEKDLQASAAGSPHGMTWTILRPVAFMENLMPGFIGKGFASMWLLNGRESRLQLISSEDVGMVAADAFIKADTDEYRNRALGLAGAEVSYAEADEIFTREVGSAIPTTYAFLARTLKVLLREQLGIMFDWFKTDGFGADVPAVRKMYPEMHDFGAWLRERSAFRK